MVGCSGEFTGKFPHWRGGVSTTVEAESAWGGLVATGPPALKSGCWRRRVQSELFLGKHCRGCAVFTESQTAKVRHSEFLKRYRQKRDVSSCSLNIDLSCPQIWGYWRATALAASGSSSPVWGWRDACVWSTPSGPRSGWRTEGSGPRATTPKQSHRVTTMPFTVSKRFSLRVFPKVRLTGEYNEHRDHSCFHFWVSEKSLSYLTHEHFQQL